MPFVKNQEKDALELPVFTSLSDAINFFHNEEEHVYKRYAIDEAIKFDKGADFLVELLERNHIDKDLSAKMGAVLGSMDPKKAPIEDIMNLLKSNDAYVRNLGISILQDYGEAIKYYIVKFLIGDDRDLRIFAVNVLGDVRFPQSRDMLVELLEKEQDVNVAMTAVDYLGEIGEPEDVKCLENLKSRFTNEPYVVFAIDSAIKSIKG